MLQRQVYMFMESVLSSQTYQLLRGYFHELIKVNIEMTSPESSHPAPGGCWETGTGNAVKYPGDGSAA